MHNFQTVGCTVGDHRKMGENVGESLDLGRREKNRKGNLPHKNNSNV